MSFSQPLQPSIFSTPNMATQSSIFSNSLGSLNTSSFFGNKEYSDITIKFSGKEVKCHKIILCTKSDYFRKLCGSDSKFIENNTSEIELKEDDPEAVEAVLRYIYCGTFTPSAKSWLYYLEVSKAATKYMLPQLEQIAFQQLTATTNALVHSGDILKTIIGIRKHGNQAKHFAIADSLEAKHQSALLKNPDYRQMIENDRTLMWKHIDRFNFADDVKQFELHKCSKCSRSFLRLTGSTSVPRTCTSQPGFAPRTCIPHEPSVSRCWMSHQEAQAFNPEMTETSTALPFR